MDRRHRRGGGEQAILGGPCPLPRCRGAYILLVRLPRDGLVAGRWRLQAGVYAYVGSGLGPGGVGARLGRHLRRAGRPWWHVDHLVRAGDPLGYSACCTGSRVESRLALECGRVLEAGPRGFGSSDDPGAATHLYRCPRGPCLRLVEDCLARLCGHAVSCEPPLDGPG